MIKVAETFEEIESGKISRQAINDPYIQAFAQKLMDMSNDIKNIEEDDSDEIDLDYFNSEYMPAIREFIVNTTGL